MTRNFNNDISTPDTFVITLELVPGREISDQKIDKIKGFAKDAYEDGRVSAVSITDNPGGNTALSPDVLGREMRDYGIDVIVHFTCRDANRVGMESRALQLARMGMKNILALTGDYSGQGFGGQSTAVFDFDSVILLNMLSDINKRLIQSNLTNTFLTGCAVSPFKYTEGETMVQYRKLEQKIKAGASYTITQLGYDIDKFEELLIYNRKKGIDIPIIASLYLLGKGPARPMHAGRIPGVYVSDMLFKKVISEYEGGEGKKHAIERIARLGAVLKGIGYKGVHIGGIHDSFATVAKVIDRMEEIGDNWEEYKEEFQERIPNAYYMYADTTTSPAAKEKKKKEVKLKFGESGHYLFMRTAHAWFFEKEAMFAPVYRKISKWLDNTNKSWMLKKFSDDPFKKIMLGCESCGDCAIQHVGFVCPESGCPKHTRNGACGGSRLGVCEVNEDKLCVWVRGYYRMKRHSDNEALGIDFVPPKLVDLKGSSSWINFHLDRDHQAAPKDQ